jgi:hypothetical protein
LRLFFEAFFSFKHKKMVTKRAGKIVAMAANKKAKPAPQTSRAASVASGSDSELSDDHDDDGAAADAKARSQLYGGGGASPLAASGNLRLGHGVATPFGGPLPF